MTRVAIIGAGGVSDQHIKTYLKFKDRCQIVAMADLYPEKVAKKADSYGLDIAQYKDHQKLLEIEEIDLGQVIVIAGLQRTGTTTLHRLVSTEPKMRSMLS